MEIIKENKVYNMDWVEGANLLPAKSVNLIIADPPYFEVKGEFDFIWKSFEDYLVDVGKWAKACKRILADNGTLLYYGHAKKIAYTQIIFDKYFNLINSLVWDKGDFMNLNKSDGLRSFAPCTERVLMYGSKSMDLTGLQTIEKEYIAPRNPFAKELKKARLKKGVSINDVAEYGKFYGNVNHGGSVTNWERGYNTPNIKQWKILCNNLPIKRKEYEDLRKEYEDLRKEYEDLRRPFNNSFELQEVLKFSNEAVRVGSKYKHDTVKPETLTRALILTCSRKGDLVLVPFAGSGTECAMAAKEERKFIGFDINKKYVDMSNKRCEQYLKYKQLNIFKNQ
ncbi:MAG: putative modification methylase [Prokaryotic dsDNA virus sp.]|nr:MAG: putative modification methylase [Prokaryotic dsDNA virus sp.]